ncbi:MAG: hypothetical protein RRY78_00305 [Clostridia bacterium]
MDIKKFKEQLNQEVERSMPDVLQKVKQTPLYAEPSIDVQDNVAVINRRASNKKYLLAITVVLILTILFTVVFVPINHVNLYKPSFTYMSMDINPSVKFLLDVKGNVVSYYSGNKSGQVLIEAMEVDKINLTGITGVQASQKIVDYATKLGYISNTSNQKNAVLVATTNANDKFAKKYTEEVKTGIEDYFINKGIYGVVLTKFKNKEQLVAVAQQYDKTVDMNTPVKKLNDILEKNVESENYFDAYYNTIINDKFKPVKVMEKNYYYKYENEVEDIFDEYEDFVEKDMKKKGIDEDFIKNIKTIEAFDKIIKKVDIDGFKAYIETNVSDSMKGFFINIIENKEELIDFIDKMFDGMTFENTEQINARIIETVKKYIENVNDAEILLSFTQVFAYFSDIDFYNFIKLCNDDVIEDILLNTEPIKFCANIVDYYHNNYVKYQEDFVTIKENLSKKVFEFKINNAEVQAKFDASTKKYKDSIAKINSGIVIDNNELKNAVKETFDVKSNTLIKGNEKAYNSLTAITHEEYYAWCNENANISADDWDDLFDSYENEIDD